MKLVGRYQVMSRIGQGAMANVYRARDPEIQRDLAIKILNNQYRRDPECVARFLREARAAGSLSHPNIMTIYDVGEAGGFPYIAMELFNGQPLDKVMEERGAFPIGDVLHIAGQLASALSYAHAQGIVHRDIKPSNIMLSDDGKTAKILDFGIARVAEGDAASDATRMVMTQVGQVLGTPRYMSPEQALGQPLDGRSDLFSLGVVLYEMICGKPAFNGGSIATIALQITSREPEPITVTPECPRGLRFIVDKLLAKVPQKRFADGGQLADSLAREMAALTTSSTEGPSRRLPLHLRFTLLAAASMAASLTLGVWFVLDQQYRAMERVALSSGSSIASFVASNVALPVMENAVKPEGEADWLPVKAFVKTASADPGITRMIVVDNAGVVRAAADPAMVGKRYSEPRNQNDVASELGGSIFSNADGFSFTRPIIYASRQVGHVEIGVRKDQLLAAADMTRWLLIGLGALMTMLIIGLSFLAGRLVLFPVRRLNAALKDASSGNLDFRISHSRRDEFGDLFDNFNALVSNVRHAEVRSLVPAIAATAPTADSLEREKAMPSLIATALHA